MKAVKHAINTVTSVAASVARGTHGSVVYKDVASFPRPSKLMTIYLKESCPFSRKVREGLSELDIDVEVRPCPIEGTRYRPELVTRGGKEQVPFLVDMNKGVTMYESSEILNHIYKEYGPGESHIPTLLQSGFIGTGSSRLATLMRALPWHGLFQYKGDDKTSMKTLVPGSDAHTIDVYHPPVDKPIHLYSFEGSPYCRLVREALDSLEIPYYLHNVARGSPRREEFVKLSGKMQVPFINDENTGTKMFESEDIIEYLYKTYKPIPKKSGDSDKDKN